MRKVVRAGHGTVRGGLRRPARTALASILAAAAALVPVRAGAGETERFGFTPHPQAVDGAVRRSFELPLASGGIVRDAVRVYNKTTKPVRVRIYGADAARAPDGSLSVAPFGAAPEGLGGSISPEVSDVTLPGRGERIVSFSVTAPSSGGARLGAIVAEEIAGQSTGESGLDLVTRIALLVKVGSGASAPTGVRLDSASLRVPLALLPAAGSVEAVIVNGAASPADVDVQAKVRSLTGRVYELPQTAVRLAPGERKTVVIPWDIVPRWGGVMKAEVTLTSASGSQELDTRWRPVFPMWLIVAANALILALSLWLYLHPRRRRAVRMVAAGARG